MTFNSPSNSSTLPKPWNLEGQVFFRGKPCNPNSDSYSVPPCSGPYPNYEIIIYQDNENNRNFNKNIVLKTKTNMSGDYKAFLNPGNYVIYTKKGISPSSIMANEFSVEEGKNTRVDLTIDTGIR